MVSWRRALLYGCGIWVIAFAVAFAIFPIRESSRPLFESIMPVVIAIATVMFARRYFAEVPGGYLWEGIRLGLVWMAVNVAIDIPVMLSPSPMQMTLVEYVGDIGLTYLIMPVITSGIGAVRAQA